MTKRCVILFIALAFFLELSGAGSCFAASYKIKPNCCSTDNSNENCLSHCTKQKADAIKIELLRGEEAKTKKTLFLDPRPSYVQQSYLSGHPLLQSRYLNQITPNSNIIQIYLLAIFNHAPPFLFQ